MSDKRLEELQDKVREMPMEQRLARVRAMIIEMCRTERLPKMSIPVQATDEDLFIMTTLEDAIVQLGYSKASFAERICDLLNALIELDRPAVAALIANRVPCNRLMADHPTVQVYAQNGGHHVGLLGILNGLCGVRENSFGLINAIFDKEGAELRDLVGFEVHTDENQS